MTAHAHSVESLQLFAPELGEQERAVWRWVEAHPRCTRQEIAAGSLIPLTSVCGRVKSLLYAGHLVVAGEKRVMVHGRRSTRELLAVSGRAK